MMRLKQSFPEAISTSSDPTQTNNETQAEDSPIQEKQTNETQAEDLPIQEKQIDKTPAKDPSPPKKKKTDQAQLKRYKNKKEDEYSVSMEESRIENLKSRDRLM